MERKTIKIWQKYKIYVEEINIYVCIYMHVYTYIYKVT